MEPRIFGKYKEITAMDIGGKEIIIAENEETNNSFICAYVTPIFMYDKINVIYEDSNYINVVKKYLEVIKEALVDYEREIHRLTLDANYDKVYTQDDCIELTNQDIKGKLVILKAESIKPEYRLPAYQLLYVTGGNGANYNARGISVFGIEIYTGNPVRWGRMDVLGIISPEKIPQWAKDKIAELEDNEI